MFDQQYYTSRKEELTKDFQELRNKYAGKILALHDEQVLDESKIRDKFNQIVAQEEESKKVISEVKEIEDKQKDKK